MKKQELIEILEELETKLKADAMKANPKDGKYAEGLRDGMMHAVTAIIIKEMEITEGKTK